MSSSFIIIFTIIIHILVEYKICCRVREVETLLEQIHNKQSKAVPSLKFKVGLCIFFFCVVSIWCKIL